MAMVHVDIIAAYRWWISGSSW